MSNIIISNKQDIAEFMYESYGCNNNAAGFIVEQTDLFTNITDGESFLPYPLQVHFLNLLKPTDRVVVVLKIRQCISSDSLIQLTPNVKISIKELLESNYRGQCLTYDDDMNLTNDHIVDIWSTGIQQVYEVCFNTGERIETTSKELFNTLSGFKKLCDLNVDDICIRFTEENGSPQTLTTITSIKQNGFKETYDLTTKIHHSYIANGLHLHNSGFSTAIVGRACYEAYFAMCPEIAIVSASRTQAEKVLDRIKKSYQSMDEALRPKMVRESMGMLELKNGCKIYSLSSSASNARGYSGSVYLDEYSSLGKKDSEDMWRALYPTTSTGGRIVAVSTPKGKTGKFYDLATKSLAEISGQNVKFESVRYHVRMEDVPHILYAKEHKGLWDGLSPTDIQQEYMLEFLDDSDESFFSEDFLMQNLVEKDRDIPLYRCYEDLGIPKDYEYESDSPLDPKFYIKNNPEFKHLLDEYSSFIAGWDIASVNDDSPFIVQGIRRENSNLRDILFEYDMKIFSPDLDIQAKHAIRLSKCFDLTSLTIDATSIGRTVGSLLEKDEFIEDILTKFVYRTDTKVDGFVKLKTSITNCFIKRRWEGSKYDYATIKQITNIFYASGKMIGRNGKDDYANSLMLCELSADKSTDSGVFFI